MLYFFHGSDRDKAREALNKKVEKETKGAQTVRITDAHTLPDVQVALAGPGMFGGKRVVVFDSVVGGANEEMSQTLLGSLEIMRDSDEQFFLLEGALDAATRKQVEKYAEKSEKFD